MKIEKDCQFCLNKFFADTRELKRGNAKFCSRSCSALYINKSKHNTVCEKCSNSIPFSKRLNKFCSRSCANSRVKTEEGKLRQSINVKNSVKFQEAVERRRQQFKPIINNCKNCKTQIVNKIFCTKECRLKFNRKDKSKFFLYRRDASFKFSLNDYPNKFDFSLIEKHGWYKAKNRGDNPDGVSRDHMYSVKEGFINNISPEIVSHPANCRIITQRSNVSKGSKSIISLEELKDRVNNWSKC